MKKVIFVTGNQIKVREAQHILDRYNIRLKQKKIHIAEPDLETIEAVARHKAIEAYKILKKPLIVEDTGIYFCAYRNFPGGFAKRMYLSLGLRGLLKLLEGKSRRAYFKAVVAYINSPKRVKLFHGALHGRITHKIYKPQAQVLAYDKVFIPDADRRPIVHMTLQEKNKISHRSKAFEKFGKWYSKKK